MAKSVDARSAGEKFWRGVASSVVSSLIAAYVLFILGASVVFAARGADGSDVKFTLALGVLVFGIVNGSVLGVVGWGGYRAVEHFQSDDVRIGQLRKWPILGLKLGLLSLAAVASTYYLALFGVIYIRSSK